MATNMVDFINSILPRNTTSARESAQVASSLRDLGLHGSEVA